MLKTKQKYSFKTIESYEELKVGSLVRFKKPLIEGINRDVEPAIHINNSMVTISKNPTKLYTVRELRSVVRKRVCLEECRFNYVYHIDFFELAVPIVAPIKEIPRPSKKFKTGDKVRIKQFAASDSFDGVLAVMTSKYCGKEGKLYRQTWGERWVVDLEVIDVSCAFHEDMLEHVHEKKENPFYWPANHPETIRITGSTSSNKYKPWKDRESMTAIPLSEFNDEDLKTQYRWFIGKSHKSQFYGLTGKYKTIKRKLRQELMKRNLWPILKTWH